MQVIIPISLYVTIEVIKLMQIYHIHNDTDFKDKRSGKTIGKGSFSLCIKLMKKLQLLEKILI